MLSRRDLILPILVLIILVISAVYIFLLYGEDFIFYNKVKFYGETASAIIIDKSFETNLFLLSFNSKGEKFECKLSVAKSTYNAYKKGNNIRISYHESNPGKCTLPYSLDFNYILSLSLILLGLFFVIISAGFAYYIKKSFTKPINKDSLRLTTNLKINPDEVQCPKCHKKMEEGYLPTVGGVCWRNIDEPVGIPTILSGLPGTTFWVKRPKLHGFHCKECNIVTFKYGEVNKS